MRAPASQQRGAMTCMPSERRAAAKYWDQWADRQDSRVGTLGDAASDLNCHQLNGVVSEVLDTREHLRWGNFRLK